MYKLVRVIETSQSCLSGSYLQRELDDCKIQDTEQETTPAPPSHHRQQTLADGSQSRCLGWAGAGRGVGRDQPGPHFAPWQRCSCLGGHGTSVPAAELGTQGLPARPPAAPSRVSIARNPFQRLWHTPRSVDAARGSARAGCGPAPGRV